MRPSMHMSTSTQKIARRATNVSLPESLVEDAKSLDINLSRACEEGVAVAIKAERERRWKVENRQAIQDYNAWIKENGIPLAEFR